MSLFTEQPILLGLMIGSIAAVLLYGWIQTGNKWIGIAGGVFVVLTPLALYLSLQVETDREKITRLINDTAKAVESNDHNAAVASIGDSRIKARALTELPRYKFSRVKVSQMQVKMLENTNPAQAEVDINVMARVSVVGNGQFQDTPVPRRLFLQFQKDDDGSWKMIDYTHTPLNGKPDMFSPAKF